MPVRPDAEPYFAVDGSIGVLLCHGFTGSPHSLRAWAESLASEGFRVSLPRLPGHGTSWQECNQTRWPDWYCCVDAEFRALQRECDQVFLTGLSMGGALALRLAQQHGSAVSGLALVNPAINSADPRLVALPWLRHVVPSLEGIASDIAQPGIEEGGYDRTPLQALSSATELWRDVRENLDLVDQPLLVYRSLNDHVVDGTSLEILTAGVRSKDVTQILLDRSYHVATMDYDAEDIFRGSATFFRRLVKG